MFLYVEYKAKDFHFDGASDVSSDEDLDGDFSLDDGSSGSKRKSTGSEDGGALKRAAK